MSRLSDPRSWGGFAVGAVVGLFAGAVAGYVTVLLIFLAPYSYGPTMRPLRQPPAPPSVACTTAARCAGPTP